MKKAIFALFLMALSLPAWGQQRQTFWLGADISGTTQLEHAGVALRNARGRVANNVCLQRLYGVNAARLRVWVNPENGWCGKDDVLRMAQRAQAHGMAVMLDFHYSDSWADPGHQDIPAAWQKMSYDQMRKALARHTADVLQALKSHGIEVKWVQVGNETTHGFLWPMGRAEENMKQYAGLTQAGYDAVKSVYPEAACIVHLDGGCDQERYDRIFDGLRQYGAKWDMIGLSVYPYWDQEAKLTSSDEETLQKAVANINHLYAKYGSESMIVETGYDADRPVQGREFMKRLIDAAAHQTDGHCHGVFYWAPELEGQYKLGAFRNHRPTVIMDAFREAATMVNARPAVTWDGLSLMIDGKRVAPVMGEIHYSRIPAEEWAREVHKMKLGGITMIACYVFWNHIEEVEGQYDWSGRRSLRDFLEVCQLEGLPVILRLGPFCHGEVRHGGIPDWALERGVKMRSENPEFLEMARNLYRQIFTQVQGLQWKDGGPVVAAQFDNEYGGHASYLLSLKKIAKEVGFDLPFYTRTGWPKLADKMPYGEMIPLFGDYADGFWDRSVKETAGNYWQAFHFQPSRANENIGSEQIDYGRQGAERENADLQYPYFTCELGGGMMTSFHRRVYLYPADAYSMAMVKLGSGSNLLGYYMYHGGTNPDGKLTTLNEMQRTMATNYNDLPVKTYDFQAPLGEFGQVNPHFFTLRKLHVFMRDFGELLAPMAAAFPEDAVFRKGDDSKLRWNYRHDGDKAFVFVNNYERLQGLSAKQGVQFTVCGVTFPQRPMVVPAGGVAAFPVNLRLGDVRLKYATAQLLARRERANGRVAYYFFQPEGFATEFMVDGKLLGNVRPQGTKKAIYKRGNTDFYLLAAAEAESFDLDLDYLKLHSPAAQSVLDEHARTVLPQSPGVTVAVTKVREARPERSITVGAAGVAEEPTDEDFEHAAVYLLDLSRIGDWHSGLKVLDIEYQGDVARLYCDGKLLDDNFYYGRHFQFGLWRVPENCRQLELRILPLQKDMEVYFPQEAKRELGEKVISVTVK